MLHFPTNKPCYEVVDNNGHDFPSYGVYKTKEQAQCKIDLLTKTTNQQEKKTDN